METGVSNMDNLKSPIYDIRFREVQILIELIKTKSVRELARNLGTTPGQISKVIKGLEMRLGVNLLNRSMYGIESTAEAVDILPFLEGIQDLHQRMQGELKKEAKETFLSVASSSFVSTVLLPKILNEYKPDDRNPVRFRFIDLPPSQFVQVGLRNGFQLCVHMDAIDWPKTWTSIEVGQVNWDLYCRWDHPIAKKPTLDRILKTPFVYPVYWSDEGIRFGDDNCPVNIRKRVRGHETATATSAVEMVLGSDQLGFLPHIITDHLVAQKSLKKITVPSWKPVRKTMYLTVKNDFIKQAVFLQLKDILQKKLISTQT
jgi:DNA-binding transcriptional LysR family regulator